MNESEESIIKKIFERSIEEVEKMPEEKREIFIDALRMISWIDTKLNVEKGLRENDLELVLKSVINFLNLVAHEYFNFDEKSISEFFDIIRDYSIKELKEVKKDYKEFKKRPKRSAQ